MADTSDSVSKETFSFCDTQGVESMQNNTFWQEERPVTFQRIVNQTVGGTEGCEMYIDDAIAYRISW